MESIIVKLKPKSQIQKKPEQKKHVDTHGGAKRLMEEWKKFRNGMTTTEWQEWQQQEQLQYRQQRQQQDQQQLQLRQDQMNR